MKALVFTCCFFIVFTLGLSAQSPAEKVLALEKQRFAAMVARDTAFLHRVLADDLLYSHTNGMVDTKASFIRSIASGTLQYQQMDLDDVAFRAYKNTVVLNGVMRIKVRYNGQVLEMKIKYLDVYRQNGKDWQLVAWQSAKLNE
jgi:hypothetical protein